MNNKNIKLFSIIALFIPVLVITMATTMTIIPTSGNSNTSSFNIANSTTDIPVIIHDNADAALVADQGNGTAENPYVIENRDITVSTSYPDYFWTNFLGTPKKVNIYPGILIRNTTVYIVIRNVKVTSIAGLKVFPIFLENNLNITIENATTFGGITPIYMRGDFSDTFAPSIIGSYTITNSSFNGWETMSEGGITATHLQSMILEGNTINNDPYRWVLTRGSQIINVTSVMMKNNAFTDCGIWLEFSMYILGYDIDLSNTVNGKSIYYIANQENFTIDSSQDPGQIILVNCKDFTIEDLSITGGSDPIIMYYCENGTLTGLGIYNSTYDGILLNLCKNITIENNELLYNSRGAILPGITLSNDPKDKIIIRNNEVGNNGRNIRLIMASNIDVINNHIFFSQNIIDYAKSIDPSIVLYGIQTMSIENTTIINNTIENCTHGIDSASFYYLKDSENITIENNNIIADIYSEGIGITIDDTNNNVTIKKNVIDGFDSGVMVDINRGIIKNNTIQNCNDFALMLQSNSKNITVYLNNFIDNNNGSVQAADYGDNNTWEKDNLGNYWSDYETRYPNATNNGITWDTPYQIYVLTTDVFDHYPLVKPYSGDKSSKINQIRNALNNLASLINDTLSGGRKIACLKIVDLALKTLDKIENLDSKCPCLPTILVKLLGIQVHVISKISKNETIIAACDDILIMINELAELM
ncbi:MAG: NosD domain-containing protein [Promethearchaeota archaeon]